MLSYVDVIRLAPRVAFTLSEEVADFSIMHVYLQIACLMFFSQFIDCLKSSIIYHFRILQLLAHRGCEFFQSSHHRFDDLYAKVSEPRGEWMWRGWQIFVT